MSAIGLAELDLIGAELLPERLVMSTVARPFSGGDPESAISSAPGAVAGSGDGAVISSAVQAVDQTDLLGTIGG